MGEGLEANFAAIMRGESRVCVHNDPAVLPVPFCASLLEEGTIDLQKGTNRFEAMCVQCAEKAIEESGVDAGSSRTVFVLSTTKGNVAALGATQRREEVGAADSALRIARHFGNTEQPVVVSNACTSGVCAQITAMRLIEAGFYDTAVVIGADEQSAFIVSGFQSLKALSDEPCRPYDKDRRGLNLGEAAACMVLSREPRGEGCTQLLRGSIANDANHISGPSRTAEGSWRVLTAVTKGIPAEQIALINAHGTSTLYNDEMESIAVDRAGLAEVPVNSLKGIFGHTMGAAGILEALITQYALLKGVILPTRGFSQSGVSRAIRVSAEAMEAGADKPYFVKLLSGFGGCNAALIYKIQRNNE